MHKTLTSIILGATLILVGCHPAPVAPPPDYSFRGVGQPGSLVVRFVVDNGGYTVAANPKVLGDVLTSATFTIDGANVPAPFSKTLTKSDWTNQDGSYKSIATSFSDVLPGEVTITVSGVGSGNGQTIISGTATVSVVPDSVTTTTVVAKYVKGGVQIGLDPNTAISPIK